MINTALLLDVLYDIISVNYIGDSMIEMKDYTKVSLYTQEQVQKVVENTIRTLKLNSNRVLFTERSQHIRFEIKQDNDTYQYVSAVLSFDIYKKKPKIVVSYDDLRDTWFYRELEKSILTAQERIGLAYIKKRQGFHLRLSNILEFTDDDHCIISYCLSFNNMQKAVYNVNNIISNDNTLFNLMCHKLFEDNVLKTAESVEDLINNFERHIVLIDMKNI